MENNVTQYLIDHFILDPAGNFREGFEEGKTYTVAIDLKDHGGFKVNLKSVEGKTGMSIKSVIVDNGSINFVFVYLMEV